MICLSCLGLPYPKIYLLPKLNFHNMAVDENFGDIALQAVGSCNTWMAFFTSMNCVVSPGQMRVSVVVTAEGAVVKIQTFGVICEGILTSEVF